MHAVTYFAPEARTALDGLGFRGFWMGYFAARSAPFGVVPTEVVTAAARTQVASVLCESGLEGKVGATAHCDVDAGGVKLRRTVQVNSVEGLMMNFDVVPVLTKEEVASSLLDEFERQLGRRPDSAQCAGNLEGTAGNTVDCTVVTGSDTASFTLTVTTVSGGSINYSYAPRP